MRVILDPQLMHKIMTSKNFVFTLNNPTPEECIILRQLPDLVYLCYQPECGEQGTFHIQGMLQFGVRRRFAWISKRVPRIHIEVMKGTPVQAKTYCSKEDTRAGDFFEEGVFNPVGQGTRSDIETFVTDCKQLSTKELIDKHPLSFVKYFKAAERIKLEYMPRRNWAMNVIVYWGASGVGKTRRASEEAGEDVYYLSVGDKTQTLWWDGYTGQNSVIIDDFYGWMPWSFMLRLLDRYPFTVQIKGGSVAFTSHNIYITSNVDPMNWYKNVPNNDVTPLIRRITQINFMH